MKKSELAPQIYVVSQEGDRDNIKHTIVHLGTGQVVGHCDDFGQASLIETALNEWAARQAEKNAKRSAKVRKRIASVPA